MIKFDNFYSEYPYIPLEIFLYFEMEIENNKMKVKTVIDFCSYYSKKYGCKKMPQPNIVSRICEILVTNSNLSLIHRHGPDGTGNQYLSIIKDQTFKTDVDQQTLLNLSFSCLVFGFNYIYKAYKDCVFPVVAKTSIGDYSVGTSFAIGDCLVTAKHCLTDGAEISVLGFEAIDLNNAKILVHQNESVDIAVIKFSKSVVKKRIPFQGEANILDEVLTMGFPKVPGFMEVTVAEKADISSRFTMTRGAVASESENIWAREKLYLITAKIKGGNSGGPVISKRGEVIGISVQQPLGEGQYDDLGYGVVVPISIALDDIKSEKKSMTLNNITFFNYSV